MKMQYLPVFYLVIDMEDEGSFQMKIITFHGKVLREFCDENLTIESSARKDFVEKFTNLRLCCGITEPEQELQFNSETFSRIYLVENYEDSCVILRSQSCLFAVTEEDSACDKCRMFNTATLQEKGQKLKDTYDEDVKPNIDKIEEESTKRKRRNRAKKRRKSMDSNEDSFDDPSFEPIVDLKVKGEPLSEFESDDEPSKQTTRKCPICNQDGFDGLLSLRKHCSRSHFNIKPFSCSQCEFRAVEHQEVLDHLTQAHEDIKCEVVESMEEQEKIKDMEVEIGLSRRKIRRNFPPKPKEAEKPVIKKYCNVCCVTFEGENQFQEDQKKHQISRSNNETVKCPSCVITVPKVNLNEHFDLDHPELRAGCCLECLKTFSPKEKVSIHYHRCHRDVTSKLCPICGVSTSALKAHINKTHKTEKPNKLICAICGNEFASKVILNRHVQFVHESEKNYKCKFCGQGFKTESHLRMHYWSLHLKVKPYKCKHCSYVAKQPNRIYEHCRDVHKLKGDRSDVQELEHEFERIREFETQHGIYKKKVKTINGDTKKHCWLCGKYFEQKERLEIHEMTHLELKPYQCSDCDSVFMSKKNLKDHLKIVHNQDFVKECEQSEHLALYEKLRNVSSSVLKSYEAFRVIETKDSETVLQCSKCDKCHDFPTMAHFYNHMDDVHGSELRPVDDKNFKFNQKLVCKLCGLETMSTKVLEKHVVEVHKFDMSAYDNYVPPPIVQLEPKVFRPRQYRCKHCLVYTAVKKFTVHRHIKKSHKIMDSTDNDLLLISDPAVNAKLDMLIPQ